MGGDGGAAAAATTTLLKLGSNTFGLEGLRRLCTMLAGGRVVITVLWLDSNEIADAGSVALAGAIAGSVTLEKINLGCNQIGDAGAAALGAAGAAKPNVTIT